MVVRLTISQKGETMFTDKELKTTLDVIKRKKNDVLNEEEGSDLDYLRNLQTLIKLENAANKALHPIILRAFRTNH